MQHVVRTFWLNTKDINVDYSSISSVRTAEWNNGEHTTCVVTYRRPEHSSNAVKREHNRQDWPNIGLRAEYGSKIT